MNLQAPSAPSQPQLPEIRDIAHPVDVFPWPMWMVVAAAIVALLIIGGIVFGIVVYLRRRPAAPPPSPRAIAIRELEQLRAQTGKLDPYAFSVKVSDVLRSYIEAQFGLRAARQTSPEFLATIAEAEQFSDSDRELLSQFLERCDLIKFARIDASAADSSILLERAVAFVQGARTYEVG